MYHDQASPTTVFEAYVTLAPTPGLRRVSNNSHQQEGDRRVLLVEPREWHRRNLVVRKLASTIVLSAFSNVERLEM